MNFTDCLSSLLFWISLVVAVIITALITILNNPKKQKGALAGAALDLSCLNPSKQDATFKVVAKSDPNPTPRSSICPAEGPGGSCNVPAAYGPIPGLETGVPGCTSRVVGDSDGNCIWTQPYAGSDNGCKYLPSDCDVTALDKCPILAKGACSKCKNGALCGKTDFRNTYYCDGHGSCDNGTSCGPCDTGYSISSEGGCVPEKETSYTCNTTTGEVKEGDCGKNPSKSTKFTCVGGMTESAATTLCNLGKPADIYTPHVFNPGCGWTVDGNIDDDTWSAGAPNTEAGMCTIPAGSPVTPTSGWSNGCCMVSTPCFGCRPDCNDVCEKWGHKNAKGNDMYSTGQMRGGTFQFYCACSPYKNQKMTGIPDVKECPGWDCSFDNQYCSQGPGYCCDSGKWVEGSCKK